MVKDKVRIRFRKDGDLRFVSHHDLMRCYERMLRRAGLPFRSTSGYNPKPRLIFALSLPLGIVGCDEVVELELDSETSPEEVHERLAAQAPPGLTILSVQRIGIKDKGQVRLVRYRVGLSAGQQAGLDERIERLMNSGSAWVERTRPHPRRIDLKPYLSGLRVVDSSLEIDLFVTPKGTARPDEILRLLDLGELIEEGAVVERTTVILEPKCQAEKLPNEVSSEESVIA